MARSAEHLNRITEGSAAASIARLAAPMLVGAILQNIQSLIDLFCMPMRIQLVCLRKLRMAHQ